jgi:hypothetical protein
MLAVESTQLASQENLRIGRMKTQLDYNGQLVPVVDLGARMGLRASAPPSEGQPLIIVQSGGKRMALAVDSVVGDRDLVIRPLPAEVRDVPAYQGAAILSRGELLLIPPRSRCPCRRAAGPSWWTTRSPLAPCTGPCWRPVVSPCTWPPVAPAPWSGCRRRPTT